MKAQPGWLWLVCLPTLLAESKAAFRPLTPLSATAMRSLKRDAGRQRVDTHRGSFDTSSFVPQRWSVLLFLPGLDSML